MRPAVSTALALLVVAVVAACGPAPSDDEEATFEDYCAAVHQVYSVDVEQTPEGVLVSWDAAATVRVPGTYVVHRRPAGTTQWQRVEEIDRLDDDFTYLDTRPAEQPGTAHEYWVTVVVPECGGESELCPPFVCDPPPVATPRH